MFQPKLIHICLLCIADVLLGALDKNENKTSTVTQSEDLVVLTEHLGNREGETDCIVTSATPRPRKGKSDCVITEMTPTKTFPSNDESNQMVVDSPQNTNKPGALRRTSLWGSDSENIDNTSSNSTLHTTPQKITVDTLQEKEENKKIYKFKAFPERPELSPNSTLTDIGNYDVSEDTDDTDILPFNTNTSSFTERPEFSQNSTISDIGNYDVSVDNGNTNMLPLNTDASSYTIKSKIDVSADIVQEIVVENSSQESSSSVTLINRRSPKEIFESENSNSSSLPDLYSPTKVEHIDSDDENQPSVKPSFKGVLKKQENTSEISENMSMPKRLHFTFSKSKGIDLKVKWFGDNDTETKAPKPGCSTSIDGPKRDAPATSTSMYRGTEEFPESSPSASPASSVSSEDLPDIFPQKCTKEFTVKSDNGLTKTIYINKRLHSSDSIIPNISAVVYPVTTRPRSIGNSITNERISMNINATSTCSTSPKGPPTVIHSNPKVTTGSTPREQALSSSSVNQNISDNLEIKKKIVQRFMKESLHKMPQDARDAFLKAPLNVQAGVAMKVKKKEITLYETGARPFNQSVDGGSHVSSTKKIDSNVSTTSTATHPPNLPIVTKPYTHSQHKLASTGGKSVSSITPPSTQTVTIKTRSVRVGTLKAFPIEPITVSNDGIHIDMDRKFSC